MPARPISPWLRAVSAVAATGWSKVATWARRSPRRCRRPGQRSSTSWSTRRPTTNSFARCGVEVALPGEEPERMTTEAPLVDTHFHVYTTDMPLDAGAWHKPLEDVTIERLIRTLDEHGVLFGVIAAASLYGDYNDYTRLALQTHKRLRGTAIVRPTIDPYALERMKADGFVGIRF